MVARRPFGPPCYYCVGHRLYEIDISGTPGKILVILLSLSTLKLSWTVCSATSVEHDVIRCTSPASSLRDFMLHVAIFPRT